MEKVDKLFTDHRIFKAASVIAAFLFIACAFILLYYYPEKTVFSSVSAITLAACIAALLVCTEKHKENTVKGILGLILGLIFAYDLRFLDKNYEWFDHFDTVIGALKVLVDAAAGVFYLFAREDHSGKSPFARYCKIVFVLLVVIVVMNNEPYMWKDYHDGSIHWLLEDVFETLAFILTYYLIVSVVCTVDKYKELRSRYSETGEWTEDLRKKTKEDFFG